MKNLLYVFIVLISIYFVNRIINIPANTNPDTPISVFPKDTLSTISKDSVKSVFQDSSSIKVKSKIEKEMEYNYERYQTINSLITDIQADILTISTLRKREGLMLAKKYSNLIVRGKKMAEKLLLTNKPVSADTTKKLMDDLTDATVFLYQYIKDIPDEELRIKSNTQRSNFDKIVNDLKN